MKYGFFVWKNLTRKKVRTILTILSITVAFILFGLLQTLSNALTGGAELAGADRLVTIHKVSLIQPLPISYANKITAVEGVDKVTYASWFGGYYQDPKNQFAQFAVDSDSYMDIYTDTFSVPDEQMQAWRQNRVGAIVGEGLIKRFDWKIGDRIPLHSTIYSQKDGSRTWEFVIAGIYEAESEGADTSSMMFHHEYLDEGRAYGEGTIGWLVISVDNPSEAPQVAERVDTLFANSPAETKTSTEKAFVESFVKQMGDIGAITTAILGAVFFTMLLVAGNTMAQAVRERIPELAVLKTLGFSDQSVLFMVLAESVLIAVIGGLLGLALAWLASQGLASALAGFLPNFAMSTDVFVWGLLMIVLLGGLAGLFPAVQGMRLSIVNALGRRQ